MGFWNSVKGTFKAVGDRLGEGFNRLTDTVGNFFKPDSGADFMTGLQNQFTGNLDYQRQLELLEKNQSFNALEAQKQRDFQKDMANTQYQRAMSDLKAAGLNPALVVSNGGAAVPTGASASSSIPSQGHSGQAGFNMLLGALTKGVSAALAGGNKVAMSAIEAQKQATAAKRDQLAFDRAQTNKEIAQINLENANMRYLMSLKGYNRYNRRRR